MQVPANGQQRAQSIGRWSSPGGWSGARRLAAHAVELAAGRCLDHTLTVPPARSASASSMQSPPAKAEATSVSILSPVFARPGAPPSQGDGRRVPAGPGAGRGWQKGGPALATRRWSSKTIGCGRDCSVAASIGCSLPGSQRSAFFNEAVPRIRAKPPDTRPGQSRNQPRKSFTTSGVGGNEGSDSLDHGRILPLRSATLWTGAER